MIAFVLECSDEHFLDFVETVFRVDAADRISTVEQSSLVKDINTFFEVDHLPYALTGYVWVEKKEHVWGALRTVSTRTALPQIILAESSVTHTSIILPTLDLLADPRFAVVNAEFRDALQEYRKTDYGDCLTKCGSAFESALKVICTARGWGFNANDSAAPLLKSVISASGLESFWEQPLILIATARNRLSKAHGGGASPRNVPKHVAEWALNATGSAIIMLKQQCL